MGGHTCRLTALGALLGAVAWLVFAVSASAVTPGPAWLVSSVAEPTNLDAGDTVEGQTMDRYALTLVNTGTRATEGEITILDHLPAGVTGGQTRVTQRPSGPEGECQPGEVVRCSYASPVPAGHELIISIEAIPSPALRGTVVNEVSVSGGGAAEASASELTPVNAGPALFGISQFAFAATDVEGSPDLQAGDHPFAQNVDD